MKIWVGILGIILILIGVMNTILFVRSLQAQKKRNIAAVRLIRFAPCQFLVLDRLSFQAGDTILIGHHTWYERAVRCLGRLFRWQKLAEFQGQEYTIQSIDDEMFLTVDRPIEGG